MISAKRMPVSCALVSSMPPSYRGPVSDPLQVLHDLLGAEVIPVAEQPLLPLAYEPEAPGPDEVSQALQELHSVEVLQEIPEPEEQDA
ncbi:hypothetical protein HUN43_00001 [Streptomyces phage Endor1]|uniref:Uncharacterized protein n=1 Tax=Streptomyces phage Endor1 TaxID=2740181 RepID=A0A7G4AWV6_9CAUD|nr:hypothetical protein KGG92_gp01 [Streptomyces phage Endor1]QMP84496.1 hypothetical protein HUN43_00001 [Streptomyces phage Endor1]